MRLLVGWYYILDILSHHYLYKVFWPSCPQHTATAIAQSVSSIFCYFSTIGVGSSIDDQLKC